jgi:hypothetical protein
MKKYPRYELRASDELIGRLRAVGPEAVRAALEIAFPPDPLDDLPPMPVETDDVEPARSAEADVPGLVAAAPPAEESQEPRNETIAEQVSRIARENQYRNEYLAGSSPTQRANMKQT